MNLARRLRIVVVAEGKVKRIKEFPSCTLVSLVVKEFRKLPREAANQRLDPIETATYPLIEKI
jgi:hypothetical protein